jgi:hypothetical protein
MTSIGPALTYLVGAVRPIHECVGPKALLTGTTARRSLMGPKDRTVRFQGRRIVIEASTRSSAESAEPGLAPRSSATAGGSASAMPKMTQLLADLPRVVAHGGHASMKQIECREAHTWAST